MATIFRVTARKNTAMKLFFRIPINAAFPLYQVDLQPLRFARTPCPWYRWSDIESTLLCLVGREQNAKVFMSYEANINPTILQNCTIRLLVRSLEKPHISGVRTPAWARNISVLQNCPDRLWGPPSLPLNGYRCSSSGGKATGVCSWPLTSTQRPFSENCYL